MSQVESKQQDLDVWMGAFIKQRRHSKYELENAGLNSKGDGYLGDVMYVKVLTGIGKETETTYHLVIKSAKKSEKLRETSPIKQVFDREIFMYRQVFPAFEKFQLKNDVSEPFRKFAQCFSVCKENRREAIILQNLKHLGFDIHDRKIPQNLHHAKCVFDNYGKYHAISLAMKTQQPEAFWNLSEHMTDMLYDFLIQANMLDGMYDTFKEALDLLKDEDPETYRKFAHFDAGALKNALRKVKKPDDGLYAILHGDCWNNNMMFKYRDSTRTQPIDMVFLDFQLSCLGSPIYDLSYYLYSVADEDLLKHHDSLLRTYHRSLTSYLEKLHETSYDITIEDIRRHWAEYGKFGLAMAPFIIKVELAESDEVVDLAERAEAGGIDDAFNFQLKNAEAFNARVKAVFKHFATFL